MRKNKLLKIFIAIILLISIQTAVIAASTGVVNVDTVRVRKKATTDSAIVALVSIGDKITIIGEEDNWYKVKAKDDHGNTVQGYIRKDLLTVEGEITTSAPVEEPKQPVENNNDNPDEKTNQAEEPNTNVEMPSENNDVTVEKNDRTISIIKTTGNISVGQKINLSEEVKIKILPSANSSNIAKLESNTEVTVVEVINKWCRVETGEYVGWVRIDQ
jgi:uncharacterized protein YgiM (DUF1202 family)